MNLRYTIGFLGLMLAACVPQSDFPLDDALPVAVTPEAPSIMMPALSSGTLVIGQSDAPVTVLLFTNYDCAYCADFEQNLMPRFRTDFIDTGKLKMQITPLLLQKYPDSDRNARLLLCGVRVGSGSDVHRQLFAGRKDFPALKTCLEDEEYLQRMMAAQDGVIRLLDVTLVPTYFINGKKITGLPEYADLRGQIEEVMRSN